jgi:hypothetical protein
VRNRAKNRLSATHVEEDISNENAGHIMHARCMLGSSSERSAYYY